MKNLKLFAVLGAFVLLFSSCEKEDAFLIGKWNVDKLTYSFTFMGVPFTETETNVGWIEFKSGGSGVDNEGGTFTWSFSDDKLTITDDEATFTMKLTTKEKKKIVGEWSQTETIEGFEITMNFVIEMTKQ